MLHCKIFHHYNAEKQYHTKKVMQISKVSGPPIKCHLILMNRDVILTIILLVGSAKPLMTMSEATEHKGFHPLNGFSRITNMRSYTIRK